MRCKMDLSALLQIHFHFYTLTIVPILKYQFSMSKTHMNNMHSIAIIVLQLAHAAHGVDLHDGTLVVPHLLCIPLFVRIRLLLVHFLLLVRHDSPQSTQFLGNLQFMIPIQRK